MEWFILLFTVFFFVLIYTYSADNVCILSVPGGFFKYKNRYRRILHLVVPVSVMKPYVFQLLYTFEIQSLKYPGNCSRSSCSIPRNLLR